MTRSRSPMRIDLVALRPGGSVPRRPGPLQRLLARLAAAWRRFHHPYRPTDRA